MPRFWYHPRIRGLLLQAAFVGGLIALAAWLVHNTVTNLTRRGIAVGFDFMNRTARFPISESLLAYIPTDSFARAILVGIVNTLFISVIVVFAGSALGLVTGLARRSGHPLASGLATVFVEAMRNTPLVVQLLFWYALVTLGLPSARQALNPLPGVFLSLRGLFVPSINIDGSASLFTASLLAGTVAVFAGIWIGGRRRVRTGRPNRIPWTILAAVLVGLILLWWLAELSVSAEIPRLQGFNFTGGLALTPEFFTIVVGLTLYSAAFIGEIIRAGIDGVDRGQWEAAKTVGLSDRQTLRLVVMPQALRIIIPPMTSQYFNIVKNTTLALVVGYPDISYVIATTINQTGQAIEGVAILMAIFLSISIAVSLLMTWYGRRAALVTR